MELICPSCGSKHRTEDYPGAFEIQCACGYAILVPDEAAMGSQHNRDFSYSAPPSAQDEQDAAQLAKLEGAQAPVDAQAQTFVSEVLTPPQDLPDGMLYDPFELQSLNPEPGAEAPSFEAAGFGAENESDEDSAPNEAPVAALPAQDPGPSLVGRIQASSIGQLRGADYRIQCAGLDDSSYKRLLDRCDEVLEHRPWLRAELRSRSIDLTTLKRGQSLQPVPELLAIEIFLDCLEMGGDCDFTRVP